VIWALKRALKEVGDGRLPAAAAKQLKLAKEYGLPHELIEFYRSYEPCDWVELSNAQPGFGAVRLLSIADALQENFHSSRSRRFSVRVHRLCGDSHHPGVDREPLAAWVASRRDFPQRDFWPASIPIELLAVCLRPYLTSGND
jgi:hypothetical protein